MVHMTYPILRGQIEGTNDVICSMYCDYLFSFFFKIKCPGKIPNIQGIWEICPGNQSFQVGKSEEVYDHINQYGALHASINIIKCASPYT